MIRLLSARSCDPRPSPRFGRVGRGLSRDKYSLITRCPLSPSVSPLAPREILVHLSSAWLQTKENLLPVYGGRDFDLWFSFSSLSLSLRWIFSREASSFLSDFLALISTLFFFSPAFRELGRDCSSRLSETCSLTCPLPPTFSMRFLLPLSRYLLYFPFFSLFVPLISATFVRVVSSRRFKIRFELPTFSQIFSPPFSKVRILPT